MSRSICSVAALLSAFLALPAVAAPRIQAAYQADLQAHQEREDEALSILLLGLSDKRTANRIRMEYDIDGRYRYDHVGGRDNSQWRGSGAMDYRISNSLHALLNLELSEIADPGVVVENELDTQTLADGRAGLQWRFGGSGRSEWSTLLQRQMFRYQSSSELDADENRLELGYRYRFDARSSLSLGFNRFDQRYRDSAQAALDTSNDEWQLGYAKRWARLELQLSASSREVEFGDGGSDRFEGYGIELSHQANSRNRLSFQFARTQEQAFRFNTRLGSTLARLEQAGLVNTDSLRLSWDYHGRLTTLTLALYQDDFEILNGAAAGAGLQRGADLTMLRQFTEHFSARLSATSLDNDLSNSVTRLTELSLIYQWLQSRRFDLGMELQSRSGEEAGGDAADVSFVLRGRARLVP